jgi:C-terminal processing protease CtpA/Prc
VALKSVFVASEQDGPADMSGMLSPGDRLVAIDGIEIGSAPPGESPQVYTDVVN